MAEIAKKRQNKKACIVRKEKITEQESIEAFGKLK